MKKVLLFLFAVCTFQQAISQCTIDFAQTQPGLYPDTLPTGFVGQSYSEDITFVMPLDTMGYAFTNFHILSISLPVGLNWQCNAFSNGCNYDPVVSQYGCVNVFGTPLLAGQYQVDVTVIADLVIVQGVPVTFQVFMEILPNNTPVSNNGFAMSASAGCLPVTVNFTNNNPGLLAYDWDFGNGNNSILENPAPQIYNTAGEYIVNYAAWADTVTTHVYTLTGVTINTIQNVFSWGYPTELNPDPYFKIKENGNVIYNSNYVQDTYPPLSWTVSIIMDPTKTYVMEVWDEDDYEIFYGGDDLIGSHTMSLNGCSGCAAGTDAIVSYSVNHVVIPPVPSVISADTIHVYGYPGEPNIVYDSLNHVLSTDSTSYLLQWYFNNSPISGATFPVDTVLLSGDYFVVAVNTAGCVAFSDTITAIYCQNLTPTINVNGNVLSTPDTTGNTFQWHDANGPISGATNSFYGITIAGSYSVVVTDQFGCVYNSNPIFVPLSVNENNFSDQILVYPNPAEDFLMIECKSNSFDRYFLKDISGKTILNGKLVGEKSQLDISSLESGVYFVMIEGNLGRAIRKLIVK